MDIFGTNVCRACLREDIGSLKCLSLFERYEGSTVSEQIVCIARVEISEGDGLPDRICPECLLQLGSALDFKRKCESSDKALHSKHIPAVGLMGISLKRENSFDFYDESHDEPDEKVATFKEEDTCTSSKIIIPLKCNNQQVKLANKLRQEKQKEIFVTCDECGENFKTKCKFRVHWKKKHLPEKLICPNCKRTFKTFKSLNTHIKLKLRSCVAATNILIEGEGKSRVFHCKSCPFKSKTLKIMVAHIVIHTGEKRFQCKDCHKSYRQRSSLQSHREYVHNFRVNEITCYVCGKLLRGREAAYKHMRIHKPSMVQCKICNKILKNQQILQIHMKRHSGIKSFACETCGATFCTSGELAKHLNRVHLKSQAFKCNMCKYSTFNEYYLNKHKSKHTATNIPCLVCGTFLDDAEKYALHQKKHLEKIYGCPNCEKMYSTKHSLSKHVRLKHKSKKSVGIEEKDKGVSATDKGISS